MISPLMPIHDAGVLHTTTDVAAERHATAFFAIRAACCLLLRRCPPRHAAAASSAYHATGLRHDAERRAAA